MKLSILTGLLSKAEGGPEGFESLASDLEYILQRLDDPGLHPNFKADIYELLADTVAISKLLASQSYDARRATGFAGNIHSVVARIVQHLAARPTNTAFGILFPRTNVLHEDIYSSEEEARQKLSSLQRLGLRENGEVVSVQITSTKLAPPKAAAAPLEQSVSELQQKIESASK